MNNSFFKVDKNLVKISVEFQTEEMVRAFYQFILDNVYEPAVNGNYAKNMRFEGFYTPETADKIIQWLKTNGYKQNQLIKS